MASAVSSSSHPHFQEFQSVFDTFVILIEKNKLSKKEVDVIESFLPPVLAMLEDVVALRPFNYVSFDYNHSSLTQTNMIFLSLFPKIVQEFSFFVQLNMIQRNDPKLQDVITKCKSFLCCINKYDAYANSLVSLKTNVSSGSASVAPEQQLIIIPDSTKKAFRDAQIVDNNYLCTVKTTYTPCIKQTLPDGTSKLIPNGVILQSQTCFATSGLYQIETIVSAIPLVKQTLQQQHERAQQVQQAHHHLQLAYHHHMQQRQQSIQTETTVSQNKRKRPAPAAAIVIDDSEAAVALTSLYQERK